VTFADTPEPPYVAVVFTSRRSGTDAEGFESTDARLVELAHDQLGFLGIEAVDDGAMGISVSYWATTEHARAWKQVAEHEAAQRLGRELWYDGYRVRVATVDREYGRPGTVAGDLV
jgi:heme-degrading monooxygenase HmoA